jgi:hypothetical protein
MLNRVELEREKNYADVVLDFVPDLEGDWPDKLEVSMESKAARVRLRMHLEELEVLAIALDNAVTGGEGELYFRPAAKPVT